MSNQHWHGLIGSHLNEPDVLLRATAPVTTAHEARELIVLAVRTLAQTFPFVAPLADDIAASRPEDCHALLGTAGFTVLPCNGSEESECVRTVDSEAGAMIKAWEVQTLMEMMSDTAERPPDDDGPGFYL